MLFRAALLLKLLLVGLLTGWFMLPNRRRLQGLHLQPSAAHHVERECAIGSAGASLVVDGGEERYLVYSPQFGMSNQFVALRAAAVWAVLLNRTLVLPHLLSHGTADERLAHGDAFDLTHARLARLAPLRLIDMDDFLALGLRPSCVVMLNAKARTPVHSQCLNSSLTCPARVACWLFRVTLGEALADAPRLLRRPARGLAPGRWDAPSGP